MNALDYVNRCHFGDCRDIMRAMIAAGVKVQTIVTSPPYWNLRDYGVEGQIGLEPTLKEFIAQLVEVFDLCREVLADDGTAWVNMGDSYAANRSYQVASSKGGAKHAPAQGFDGSAMRVPEGLKSKDLCGQPWRLAFALQDAGWYLRQDIIWEKPNPMPESVRDRCTKSHEYLFLLSKSEKYFYDFNAMQEPVNGNAHPRGAGNMQPSKGAQQYALGDERHRTKSGLLAYAQRQRDRNAGVNPKAKAPSGWDTGSGEHRDLLGRYSGTGVGFGRGYDAVSKPRVRPKQNESFSAAVTDLVATRNRRSVWTIPTQPYSAAHFATFPEKLVEPCVLAGSRPGDIVFDPFFGSGTTGQVAQRLGRRYIGCELNPAYEALQRERLKQLGFAFEMSA